MERKAFYVDGVHLYDPTSGPPDNGMDYLRSVIQERRLLPKIFVSEIDPRQYDSRRNKISYQPPTEPPVTPLELLPTPEWQNEFLAEFEKYRDVVREKEEELSLGEEGRVVPHHNDLKGWQRICIGSKNSPEDFTFVKPAEVPVVETIGLINELTVRRLIHYHTIWLETQDISETNTLWLYSLFSKLEEPILDSTAADLRKILMLCCTKRSTLKSKEDPLLLGLNQLITIVTQFFGQVESYHTEDDPFLELLLAHSQKKRWRSRMWEENSRKKPRQQSNNAVINLSDFLGGDNEDMDEAVLVDDGEEGEVEIKNEENDKHSWLQPAAIETSEGTEDPKTDPYETTTTTYTYGGEDATGTTETPDGHLWVPPADGGDGTSATYTYGAEAAVWYGDGTEGGGYNYYYENYYGENTNYNTEETSITGEADSGAVTPATQNPSTTTQDTTTLNGDTPATLTGDTPPALTGDNPPTLTDVPPTLTGDNPPTLSGDVPPTLSGDIATQNPSTTTQDTTTLNGDTPATLTGDTTTTLSGDIAATTLTGDTTTTLSGDIAATTLTGDIAVTEEVDSGLLPSVTEHLSDNSTNNGHK